MLEIRGIDSLFLLIFNMFILVRKDFCDKKPEK